MELWSLILEIIGEDVENSILVISWTGVFVDWADDEIGDIFWLVITSGLIVAAVGVVANVLNGWNDKKPCLPPVFLAKIYGQQNPCLPHGRGQTNPDTWYLVVTAQAQWDLGLHVQVCL